MIDIFNEIWQTMCTNKLRTALTGLAVVWGIFMLIILVGMAQGVINSFEESNTGSTDNYVQIYPGMASMPYQGLKEGRYVPLKRRNMADLTGEMPDRLESAVAEMSVGNTTISTSKDYVSTSCRGVYPQVQMQNNIKLDAGRFINDADIAEKRKVIVLDGRTVDLLFDRREDAVGALVKVNDLMYKVIGYYDSQWRTSIFVPYTTAWALTGYKDEVDVIYAEAKGLKTQEDADRLDTDLRKTLAKPNRFDPDDQGAVWIWNRFSSYLTTLKAQSILKITMWTIGLLTLITGIVGVSNIMFVSVRERTHEIGIRRAIGAKPRSILMQVVLESVVMTATFGYIGIILGMVGLEIIGHYFADANFISDPKVDIRLALQVMAVLVVAGALAGIFPALRALKINPVEALRTE